MFITYSLCVKAIRAPKRVHVVRNKGLPLCKKFSLLANSINANNVLGFVYVASLIYNWTRVSWFRYLRNVGFQGWLGKKFLLNVLLRM